MPWFDRFDRLAAERLPDLEICREEPMDRHTTFRVGGPARRFVRPASAEACAALLALAESEGWPVLVMGNGSNLLVADGGADLLVIHTGHLDGAERVGERTIRAGAGLSLARVASFAQREGLRGLEFAHGIPGSLGGAVCMNAGAYGGEMKQVLSAVTAWMPGEGVRRLERETLALGYRRSVFSGGRGAVLAAENHNKYGGLWSAVSEVLAQKCPVPAGYVAVEDEFGEVGSQGYLQERFGLTAAHIVEQAKAVLARK